MKRPKRCPVCNAPMKYGPAGGKCTRNDRNKEKFIGKKIKDGQLKTCNFTIKSGKQKIVYRTLTHV